MVRHPVVWPGGVLQDGDGELQGGGQAAHGAVHGLPHLPDLHLVRLQTITLGVRYTLLGD